MSGGFVLVPADPSSEPPATDDQNNIGWWLRQPANTWTTPPPEIAELMRRMRPIANLPDLAALLGHHQAVVSKYDRHIYNAKLEKAMDHWSVDGFRWRVTQILAWPNSNGVWVDLRDESYYETGDLLGYIE